MYFWWQILTYVLSICCIFWEKNSTFQKKKTIKKVILLKKWAFFQYFVFPSLFLCYDLSFDMQKPSHVTNIYWKFHDFFLSGLGAIKVLHFTVWSEDGVGLKSPLCLTDILPGLMNLNYAFQSESRKISVTESCVLKTIAMVNFAHYHFFHK